MELQFDARPGTGAQAEIANDPGGAGPVRLLESLVGQMLGQPAPAAEHKLPEVELEAG